MDDLRVVTVDDELLALRRLKFLLAKVPGVQLVGEADCCSSALELIEASRPDVVLLDVQMRDGDGLAVARTLDRVPMRPAIIFVTGFEQHALHAFAADATDYLLKPVERDRLARALCRARDLVRTLGAERRLSEMQEIAGTLRSSLLTASGSQQETEFWLQGTDGRFRIAARAIDCVSSEDDYVALHTRQGTHFMRGSLKQFERRVPTGMFIRVHRRWLVKRRSITELAARRPGHAEIVLGSGRRIPVGRVYLKNLRAQLKTRT